MPVELGLWRIDGGALRAVQQSQVELESDLESQIESRPEILGKALLIIGRQVHTPHGGILDLLALDETATLHVIELKRSKTPRDVTAQILDYASWTSTLGREEIDAIFTAHRPDIALEKAFAERFGEPLPDEVNAEQQFTIVAENFDGATERIVRFLNEGYGVPLNVVFFRHFVDEGRSYLARTWLVDEQSQDGAVRKASSRKREPWNGRDWYVSFGHVADGRQWDDAREYGFVSGGGQRWYSQTLRSVPVGARVFVCVPRAGYVGVGEVIGEPTRFDAATLSKDGREHKLAEAPLKGVYRHDGDDRSDDFAEWVLPVRWYRTMPLEQAVWITGMFANQNTATKMRNRFTIEQVTAAFGLED